MDKLTFTVEMTKALAWPAVLAGSAAYFRREISLAFRAAIGVFRRLKKLSYGGVSGELVDAVVSAAQTSEIKAVEAAEKLVKEDNSAEEKERLVRDLQAATSEAERWKKAANTLMKSDALPAATPSSRLLNDMARSGLKEIVSALSAEKIVELSKSKKEDELFSLINDFIRESTRMDKPFTNSFPIALYSFRELGLILSDNTISPYGLKLVVDVANGKSVYPSNWTGTKVYLS